MQERGVGVFAPMAKPRQRRTQRLGQYESPLYRELVTRFTTNLRQLREARGWTQEEAGDRCGMVMQQFQRIEAGKMNLTFTTLARVAGGFEVDPVALLALVKSEGAPETAPPVVHDASQETLAITSPPAPPPTSRTQYHDEPR